MKRFSKKSADEELFIKAQIHRVSQNSEEAMVWYRKSATGFGTRR